MIQQPLITKKHIIVYKRSISKLVNFFSRHIPKNLDYSEYRELMAFIRKINNIAFFSSIPFFIGQLVLFISGFFSDNPLHNVLAPMIMLFFSALCTFMSTYHKNKVFAVISIPFYFIAANSSIMTILAFPVLLTYPLLIKTLIDEEKLRHIDGYPYFSDPPAPYNEIYGIKENSLKDMTYTESAEDDINELPQDINIYNYAGEMFVSDNLYMEDAYEADITIPELEPEPLNDISMDTLHLEDPELLKF